MANLTTAINLHKQGQLGQALDLYNKMLVNEPTNFDLLHLSGVLLGQQGDFMNGMVRIKKALVLKPHHPKALYNLGNIHLNMKNYVRASGCFERVLKYQPGHFDALVNLGNANKELENFDQAWVSYQEAYSIDPDAPNLLSNMALLFKEQKEYKEAILHIKKAIQYKPNEAKFWLNLGTIFTKMKDYKSASQSFDKAKTLEPSNGHIHLAYGEMFHKQKNWAKANQFYLQAIKLMPQNGQLLSNLAVLYEDVGQMEDALSCHLKAFACDPFNGVVIVRYANFEHYYKGLLDQFDFIALNIKKKSLGASQKAELMSQVSLFHWVKNDKKKSEKCVNSTFEFLSVSPNYDNFQNTLSYMDFLSRLIKTIPPQSNTKTSKRIIHFIGDSHTLTACYSPKINAKIHLIIGAKAYHLGADETNKYQWAFKQRFENIPEKSTVVFCFGEIDCRPNEGIFPILKTDRSNAEPLIKKCVNNYLDFIEDFILEKKLDPWIWGIPMPSRQMISVLEEKEQSIYLDTVKFFNQQLIREAEKRNWGYIDNVKTKKELENEPLYHLDQVHLHPNIFNQNLHKAFSK